MIRSIAVSLRVVLWLLTCAFILLIMVVSFGDVVMRTFARPIPGAYEVTEIAVGAMVFAALPVVTLTKQHISVTLLTTLTSRVTWLRWFVLIFSRAVTMLVLGYLGYRLWLLGNQFDETGTAAIFAGFPLAPFAWFASVMCWLSAIASVIAPYGSEQTEEI